MEIVMVHWLIKKGREADFERHWQEMKVEKGIGLYREVLTTPEKNTFDAKFHTFSIESPHYTTYVNVGFWKSLKHFDNAVKKYFPKATSKTLNGKTKQNIELIDFEFKLRERIVLRKVSDRGTSLPKPDLKE